MDAEQSRRRYDPLRRTTKATETRAEIARAARRLFDSWGWADTTARWRVKAESPCRRSMRRTETRWGRPGRWPIRPICRPTHRRCSRNSRPRQRTRSDSSRRWPPTTGACSTRRRRHPDHSRRGPQRTRPRHDLQRRPQTGRRNPDPGLLVLAVRHPAPGLDLQTAVDVYAAICNIDVYTTLTTERGWPPPASRSGGARPCPANSSPERDHADGPIAHHLQPIVLTSARK